MLLIPSLRRHVCQAVYIDASPQRRLRRCIIIDTPGSPRLLSFSISSSLIVSSIATEAALKAAFWAALH